MKEAANARALVRNYAKYAEQQWRRLLGTGSREERENWAQHAQAGEYHTCLESNKICLGVTPPSTTFLRTFGSNHHTVRKSQIVSKNSIFGKITKLRI